MGIDVNKYFIYMTFKEKEIVTYSSILTWEMPWTEEPGRLQSIGLHRVGHNWSNLACVWTENSACLFFNGTVVNLKKLCGAKFLQTAISQINKNIS